MTINALSRYFPYAVALIILIVLAGCTKNYGRFNWDEQVQHAFENNQLSTDYKYFYNGHHNLTYAIIGIDPKYRLESKFWREVEPNTEEFSKLTNRIWQDYNRYTYGANLLDPAGNKIGVWYSSVYTASLKFDGDNEVEVLMQAPWLMGPGDGRIGGFRTP